MQVTETLSDGLRRSYAVRVPAGEIDARARARLADIGKTLRLPGFRPGKVPANLVRKRFGTSVMAEVLQEAVNGAADEVVRDRQLRPAGQPRVALDGTPPLAGEVAQDLELTVELELLPDIELPDLTQLSLTRYRAEPSEEVIATALASVAAQNRTFEDLEPRPAETGDVLVVDFTGRIDGEPFEGGAATDAAIEVGGAGYIPGFTEQMVGMSPGDTRSIDVTFPDEYAAAPTLAGKAAQFEIAAKKLQHAVVPEQDDALAKAVGMESFAELREAVVAQIQREYGQMARLRIKRELLDALAELARFPTPQNLLETEFGSIWQRVAADRNEGRIDEEDAGKDEPTLQAEYRAIADRRVRLGLLLAEIGRVNHIDVSQAELTDALRAEMARYPGQEQAVLSFFQKNAGAVQQLRGPIFEDKVVNHILDVAQVEDRLVQASELAMPDVNPVDGLSGAGEAFAASDTPAEPAEPAAGTGEAADSEA
jgi:trigger factor